MKDSAFDTITRHAAGVVSRRGSLRLLGGAALAGALTAPGLAGAGKTGKKAAKQCRQQGGQCRAALAEACAQLDDPQACEKAYFPCCARFERCNAGAGLECIFDADGGEV